jgi:hypothetical protein
LQSSKFPAASRLIRVAIFACAGIRQLCQPIVKDIFPGAAGVVTNLDLAIYCNLYITEGQIRFQ